MSDVQEKISDALAGFGGYLRCEECGRLAPVGNAVAISDSLRNGWPRCHGYTMRWWTQRQINAGLVPDLTADPVSASLKGKPDVR